MENTRTNASYRRIVLLKLRDLDTKTNIIYEAKTNSEGTYTFPKVLPGPGCNVTFSKDGFASLDVANLYLGVNSTHTQNAQLAGNTAETVEVTESATRLSFAFATAANVPVDSIQEFRGETANLNRAEG